MKLSRRRFLQSAQIGIAGLLSRQVLGQRSSRLSGKILGLTTLDSSQTGEERSELFRLDLKTGHSSIESLGDYRFGHSLIPLPTSDSKSANWLAVPYGDDRVGCLVLNSAGRVQHRILAPEGYGFGGHAVALPALNKVFVHLNPGRYDPRQATFHQTEPRGKIALIDIATGTLRIISETTILHAHDMALSRDGNHILVSDDGTKSSFDLDNNSDADTNNGFSLQIVEPAYYLFDSKDFSLIKKIPQGINGSVVHLVEDMDRNIIAGVEQYVNRNKAGIDALRKLLGDETDKYIASFDPDIFAEDLPYPGPLFSTNLDTGSITRVVNQAHQDPFDICLNEFTGTICNVFTASDTIARRSSSDGRWTYTKSFNCKQPFGLCDISGTPFMAVNGFEAGISIFDVRDMRLKTHFQTQNYGLKHLQFAPGL